MFEWRHLSFEVWVSNTYQISVKTIKKIMLTYFYNVQYQCHQVCNLNHQNSSLHLLLKRPKIRQNYKFMLFFSTASNSFFGHGKANFFQKSNFLHEPISFSEQLLSSKEDNSKTKTNKQFTKKIAQWFLDDISQNCTKCVMLLRS